MIYMASVQIIVEGSICFHLISFLQETRIRLQVQYEQDHKVVILTCTVDTGTLYISLYNDKTLLARCWITPSLFCRNFLGDRGKFSIDHKINQYTLTISDLKNSIGYWICSHGGRRDTSSSVLIKGKNDKRNYRHNRLENITKIIRRRKKPTQRP